MSLQTIEFIIGSITLLFAYIFSVMLVGRAEAEIATLAGDDTPRDAGFLSWDPLVFVDLPGFICVMLFGMGWGRPLPFNPHNITGRHKLLSVFLVYMAQPVISLLLVFVSLLATALLIGQQALFFVYGGLMQSAQGEIFHELSRNYQYTSPLLLVCVTLLLALATFNSFNAVWTFINNGFHYFLFIGHERNHDYMKHAEALTFFGPLVVLIIYFGLLRYVLLKYLILAASIVATLLGASL